MQGPSHSKAYNNCNLGLSSVMPVVSSCSYERNLKLFLIFVLNWQPKDKETEDVGGGGDFETRSFLQSYLPDVTQKTFLLPDRDMPGCPVFQSLEPAHAKLVYVDILVQKLAEDMLCNPIIMIIGKFVVIDVVVVVATAAVIFYCCWCCFYYYFYCDCM